MEVIFIPGVKGQKWGQRRYQNYDGTWTEEGKLRRRKNPKLYRISERDDDKLIPGMYAYTKIDSDKYVGVYGRWLKRLGKDVVLRELQVSGNLRMPTYDTSKQIMKDTLDKVIKGNKDKENELGSHFMLSQFTDDNVNNLYRKANAEFERYLKTGKVGNNLYDCLNVDLCFRRSDILQEIARDFYENNKKAGYNVVKDINDSKQGLYKSKMPLIITDTSNMSVVKVKDITDNDINAARARLGSRYLARFAQSDKELDEWIANGMPD